MREPTFQAMREALSANACAETTDWRDGVSVESATLCPSFFVYPRHVHVESRKKRMGDQSRGFRRASFLCSRHRKNMKPTKLSSLTLRARGGSTAAACTSFFSHKFRESHISTLLYKVSSSAQHFPPVPSAPMGHPRPPGADRSRSGFI